MAVTQKINRAALDIFILLVFFYAPAFGISLCRNAADALRFSSRNIAQEPAKKASRIFKQQLQNLSTDCNKKVTDLLLAKCVAEAKRFN